MRGCERKKKVETQKTQRNADERKQNCLARPAGRGFSRQGASIAGYKEFLFAFI
jgi:hypothetical protein